MYTPLKFEITYQDPKSRARLGKLTTAHGIVETPMFVPVGTQATVKSLTPDDLREIGVQLLFGNTYHLHLRPGEDIVERFGGLAHFMRWEGVTMTDSGGFQAFSLAKEKKQEDKKEENNNVAADERESSLVKITQEGVVFKSHLDGSLHTFTPEQSIAIQKKLGADIVLSLDQCSSYPITYETAKADMQRTHAWAKRSLQAFQEIKGAFPQSLYGIVQGSVYQDLRKESAEFITSLPFDGFAIGGVSVGESKEEMRKQIDWTIPYMPDGKIRHLLGIGDVDDVFDIIERGIDTFDCVTPSRLGRVGVLFLSPADGGNMENRHRYDIGKSVYAIDERPLNTDCRCKVCRTYTRGYIHHLFRAKELLAYRLATYHNIYFLIHLVEEIKKAIKEDRFFDLKKEWLGR